MRSIMSWDEKDARRNARRNGDRCRQWIAHTLAHQAEADQWHKVLGAQSDHGRLWEARADQAQIEAMRAAVLAGRWAREAQAEADARQRAGEEATRRPTV